MGPAIPEKKISQVAEIVINLKHNFLIAGKHGYPNIY